MNERARAEGLIQEVRKLVKGQSGDLSRLRQLADDLRQLAAGLAAAEPAQSQSSAPPRSDAPNDVVDAEYTRRRVERDRNLAARQAKRELPKALVDLSDGFDRAPDHIGESPDSVAAGLRGMQRRQLAGSRGREVVRERRRTLRPDAP